MNATPQHSRIALTDSWTLTRARTILSDGGIDVEGIPAAVPGTVHTDLLTAGLIDDPYRADNEPLSSWIGRSDWIYRLELPRVDAEGSRVDLVFEGLDTFATVLLNGVEIGRTTSMFTSLRLDVTAGLTGTGDLLEVRFDAPYTHALARQESIGDLPSPYDEPYPFVRKTASNFGWDWGPTLVTAGIWKPAFLEVWSTARIASVMPTVTVDGDAGRVEAHVTVAHQAEASAVLVDVAVAGIERTLRFEAEPRGDGTATTDASELAISVDIASPALWWPRGYGEQARYDLVVTLRTVDGVQLDRWQRQIGFRTVEIDATPDADGTPFTIVVNGVPVFARGVNWIPDDCFPVRVDSRRYRERLEQAAAANVNLVRVWGGGNYESEEFYDVADDLGLLVAQDFLFACAAYPETDALLAEVEAEVRENVVRLAPHPSLVLWFGGNETLWGHEDWEWKPILGDRPWGERYWLELLPAWLAELAPAAAYWANSPYSGTPARHPNDPAHGTSHAWEVWNSEDYLAYRELRPRFVAEFGYQAPASHRTLLDAVGVDELRPDSPVLQHHQKAVDGEAKLQRGLDAHFAPVESFDDWLYATQLNQARAITTGIEHFRSLRPLCMGAVLWQLNDCWPALSWSVVDSAGRRKPSWYALRRAYADRLLTVQPSGDSLQVVAVNEHDEPWHVLATATRAAFDGTIIETRHLGFRVAPRSAARLDLAEALSAAGEATSELLVIDDATTNQRATWFFAEDLELDYPAPAYSTSVTAISEGYRVDVEAVSFLRDVAIFADRIDPSATVDEMLVTLLPGERATFVVSTELRIDEPARFGRAPQLRCVNELNRK